MPGWARPVFNGIVASSPSLTGEDIRLRIAHQTMTVPIASDREHVLLLSDHSPLHPHRIFMNLKKQAGCSTGNIRR